MLWNAATDSCRSRWRLAHSKGAEDRVSRAVCCVCLSGDVSCCPPQPYVRDSPERSTDTCVGTHGLVIWEQVLGWPVPRLHWDTGSRLGPTPRLWRPEPRGDLRSYRSPAVASTPHRHQEPHSLVTWRRSPCVQYYTSWSAVKQCILPLSAAEPSWLCPRSCRCHNVSDATSLAPTAEELGGWWLVR